MTKYNLIVAMCRNNGIGSQGKIPWHIKKDLHYFAKITKGDGHNAVIMGNNTWKSIPEVTSIPYIKGLPCRDNFVLSRQSASNRLKTFTSLASLETYLTLHANNYESLWVIGGAQIYKQFLEANKINKCYVTYIDKEFDCDTFFPDLDMAVWQEIERADTYDTTYECIVSYRVYSKI